MSATSTERTSTETAAAIAGVSVRLIDLAARRRHLRPDGNLAGIGCPRHWPDSEIAIARRCAQVAAAIPGAEFLAVVAAFHEQLRTGHDVVLDGPWGELVIVGIEHA